jgi:DNA-binding winged helix-turn-helix (wHTH) protein/Flp pilus assembly protein TadD
VRYTFGPFDLDTVSRHLTRDGQLVPIPDRHVDILLALLVRPGEILSKNALVEAAWKDVAVTDNSLEQAISSLRKTLEQSTAGPTYIETVPRRGYRLVAPVTKAASRHSTVDLEAILDPFRAFVQGRAALETLDGEAIQRARTAFEQVIRASPDYVSAHVGLANALALQLEATRARASLPDPDILASAVHHASEACRLDPASAEAWCVLGLIAQQSGDRARAVAAAHRATMLEPDNWRHHLRLAYVSWGEERLQAARRALRLCPDLALCHWLAATVYIARQAFAEAEQELIAGAAAQDRQVDGARFRAVGLHLLLGLLHLSRGADADARRELEKEIASGHGGQIYTAQARANAWCAIGALHLRSLDAAEALEAFDRAMENVPEHPPALAARAFITANAADSARLEGRVHQLREIGARIEAAFAEAIPLALHGRHDRAAGVLHVALDHQGEGSSGWTLPVDPFLHVAARPEPWRPVLELLRSRAL